MHDRPAPAHAPSHAPHRNARPTRSALARHHKRQLEGTQHVSSPAELDDVARLAAFPSTSSPPIDSLIAGKQILNSSLRVLRNRKNHVYHRALAARALGLVMQSSETVRAQVRLEVDDLVDALLQILNVCRRSKIQNADTRRVHVNCCLVISMLMNSRTSASLQLMVTLDSELMAMAPQPSEVDSGFLLLTIRGRPESRDQAAEDDDAENDGRIHNARLATKTPPPLPPYQTLLANRKKKKKKKKRATQSQPSSQSSSPVRQSNQVSPPRQAQAPRVAWTDQTGAAPPAKLSRLERAVVTPIAGDIERRTTPARVFHFARHRVVTPIFGSVTGVLEPPDGLRSATPLIPPRREKLLIEDEEALQPATRDDNEEQDEAESASPAVPPPPTAALLHPHDMLRMLQTQQMPLSLPEHFRKAHASRQSTHTPPNRLRTVDYGQWNDMRQQHRLQDDEDEGEIPNLPVSKAALRAGSNTKTGAGSRATSVVPLPASAATPVLVPEDHVTTAEYKLQRLRDILASPVDPSAQTAQHLRSLARRVNTSVMTELDGARAQLELEEAQARQELAQFIEHERDRLPLKFLFQLPGGAAYCRHRMRRAMALWLLTFEDNQKRAAMTQWKAWVEQARYALRGVEYQRLVLTKRLKVAIAYVLRGYQQQAMRAWVEATQWHIWKARDTAVRVVQRQVRRWLELRRLLAMHDAAPFGGPYLRDVRLAPCRHLPFQIPPRVRAERRRLWHASELVQWAYHRKRFRAYMRTYRQAASRIQARARMRIARHQYRVAHRCIVRAQARVRGHRCRVAYLAVRSAAMRVQHAYRALCARRLLRIILCAQRIRHETCLTATLNLQRVARGFLGRRKAADMRAWRRRRFLAALKLQRCWYQRHNEWSTFLLLGCLRETQADEEAFDHRVLTFTRNNAAKMMQRAFRRWRRRYRTEAAIFIQQNVRQWLAHRLLGRLRRERMAHRRIKWFVRGNHARRGRYARTLQFWWLEAVPGRLRRHLRNKAIRQAIEDRRALWVTRQHAATVIQAAARGRRDRRRARMERSARTIQATMRAFLRWKRLQAEIARRIALVAQQSTDVWVAIGLNRVHMVRMAHYDGAAGVIQRCFRGVWWRTLLVRASVLTELQTRMARRIQQLWRDNTQRRMARQLVRAQRRLRSSSFASIRSVSQVLKQMMTASREFYDPDDEICGLATPTWLRRHGLDAKYATLPAQLPARVDELRALGGDACREHLERLGVVDDDVEQLTISIFAREAIAAAKQQRRVVAQAQSKVDDVKTARDLVRMKLAKQEELKLEREKVVDDMLTEASEFRHAPTAVRKRLENAQQQLGEVEKAMADTKAALDKAESELGVCSRELATQTHVLSSLQAKETSALYNLHCLRPIKQLTVAKELHLEAFPGMEARATSFATALEGVTITKWQLHRFFAEAPSVADVKLRMKTLTYWAQEAEMKRVEGVRLAKAADILQDGVERVCVLLGVPLERVLLLVDVAQPSTNTVVEEVLIPTLQRARRATQPHARVEAWRQGTDELLKLNHVATYVQALWRARAARKIMRLMRSDREKLRIKAEYVAERAHDHVTPIWQAERDKEKEELDKWNEEQELAQRLAVLDETLRYPYVEEWDDTYQVSVYYPRPEMFEATEEDQERVMAAAMYTALPIIYDRPTYTIPQENACIRIQRLVRGFLARLVCLTLLKIARREGKRVDMEERWHRHARERSQLTTLRVRVRVKEQPAVRWWLGSRRMQARRARRGSATNINVNSPPKPKKAVKGRGRKISVLTRNEPQQQLQQQQQQVSSSNIEEYEPKRLQLEAALKSLEVSYHRSVRAENRKHWLFPAHSRPPNVHAQQILELLAQLPDLQRSLAPSAHTNCTLRYTMVDPRFGWKQIHEPAVGNVPSRSYYFHAESQTTTWTRPEYTFEEEFACIKMQSVVRMQLGKTALSRMVEAMSFEATVRAGVERAAQLGWVGFGIEGISTAVFLARFGLAKYTVALSKAKVDDLYRLSDAKLKKLGWTKEECALIKQFPVRLLPKKPLSSGFTSLSPSDKHPFNFIHSERALTQMVATSFPNQQGRVLGLIKAMKQSTTPISYRQLEMHLRKYAGRPDDALENIGEIASLDIATRAPQERAILGVFVRAVERCVVLAANLRLKGLHRELSDALSVLVSSVAPQQAPDDTSPLPWRISPSTPLLRTRPERQAQLAQQALARYPSKNVRGMWEPDVTAEQRLSAAQMALYLRERALEHVLRWIRSAQLCQATFRMHTTRRWYLETQAFRAARATQIQCLWRMHCAYEERSFLESQQRADYEQCYDKKTKEFYYIYRPTNEKLADEPCDHLGRILPYRPMVQDRVSKLWVLAWPHLDEQRRKQKAGMTNDLAEFSQPCSICHAERAVRRCADCTTPSGDFVDHCLVCFYNLHAPDNAETNWHTSLALHHSKVQAFHCIECKRFATQRCLQCNEHYCARCFQRVHARGHKRTGHKCEYFEAMARVCVECEARVAFQLCLVCQDAMCEDCMTRTHHKGHKAEHELKLIKQALEPEQSYCEQCHARRGDTRCEFCARMLCQVCLRDRHTLICPETELHAKKLALLGDHACVECGKVADRECVVCGDRYCSVRWMGNPGCFETFHAKGKRAEHTFQMLETLPAVPAEIVALEEKVRLKRRQDAEDAEAEAKNMAAQLTKELEASDRASKTKRAKKSKSYARTHSGKHGAGHDTCTAPRCTKPRISRDVAFCVGHLTSQHALEVSEGPLEAAKLLVEAAKGTKPTSRFALPFAKFLPAKTKPSSPSSGKREKGKTGMRGSPSKAKKQLKEQASESGSLHATSEAPA
ncbi:TPA: hypothetical protein N0F65_004274 [Lagenidium giganteum]|uniref:WW domain-containing protein n=1 Tax=Lagenidium giganteum TaxID=4803 RepID=A0AAV2Z9Q8_9STRA|nr:TPA: hypothetical protein N0F65_004274 [Lagenidium giganteum]